MPATPRQHGREEDIHAQPPPRLKGRVALVTGAREFRRRWIARCRYAGDHATQVRRSLLALKLLQHAPSGSFVAAATTSIPERIGGPRNWDYRYAWLRDGSLIVMAFETTGYSEESHRFRQWLSDVVVRDAPDNLQMLYRVDGSRNLEELTLDHLEGYRRSQPVRVGNAAVEQHQLDTYGEVMMCFHRADALFRERGPEIWPAVRALVDAVAARWDEPDSGIWELRSEHRHHVYSKTVAWLALDHAITLARERRLPAPIATWERARESLGEEIETRGRDRDAGWMQSFGHPDADAANLLFPILGFSAFDDEATRETLATIQRALASGDLVHRYDSDDGIPGREGTFLAAAFWLAHTHAVLGDRETARKIFTSAANRAGPFGLLSEEADDVSGELLGNHPQGFSHLALILAADAIEQPAGWRERRAGTRGVEARGWGRG